MKSILFICCSRERPHRFTEMARSLMLNATYGNRVNIALYIDADEPRMAEYFAAAKEFPCTVLINTRGHNINFLYNEMAMTMRGDIVGVIADDVVCRTPRWDEAVEYALTVGDLQTVSPYDGHSTEFYPHFFVTREWLDTIGYLFWPEFEHFHADTMFLKIVDKCGQRAVMQGVLFEHMHFKYDKAEVDNTYAASRQGNYLVEPNALLFRLQPEIEAAAQRAIRRWGKVRNIGAGPATGPADEGA